MGDRHRPPIDHDGATTSVYCGHKKRSAMDQRLGVCYSCREAGGRDDFSAWPSADLTAVWSDQRRRSANRRSWN